MIKRSELQFRAVFSALGIMALVLCAAVFALPARAAFTEQINYQGKLTNNSNSPVADGDYNLQFRLCADSGCSSVLWSESYTGANKVAVSNGLFSVMLGSQSSISSVNFNQALYLEVQVGGTGTPSWETLLPRKVLGAVPNAFNAKTLDGLATSSLLRSDQANVGATINNLLFSSSSGSNLQATYSTFTNATSTNLFASVFNAVSGWFTNLTATIASITNLTVTNSTSTNATSTNLFSSNLAATSATSTNLFSSLFGSTNANMTNATSSNFFADALSALTGTITNLFFTNASGTNFVAANSTTTNATSTNLFSNLFSAVTGSISNLISSNVTTSQLALTGALSDGANSTGTSGYVLQTTGTSTRWVSTSSLGIGASAAAAGSTGQVQYNSGNVLAASSNFAWDNSGQTLNVLGLVSSTQALTVSATATNAYLSNLLSVSATTTNQYVSGQLGVNGGLMDGAGSVGTAGYVLQTTGTSTRWVSTTTLAISGGSSQWTTSGSDIYYNLGNVGIGTSSPANLLGVESANSFSATFMKTSGARVDIGVGTTFGSIGTNSNHQFSIFTNGTDRLIVTNAGNVGIGTSSPIAKLSVAGSGTGSIIMGDPSYSGYAGISLNGSLATGNYNFLSGASDRDLYINRPTGNSIHFKTNNGPDQMSIKSTGYVGIGTSSPGSLLHIEGSSTGQYVGLTINDTAYQKWFIGTNYNSNALSIYDQTAGATRLMINSVGNVGIGTTTPADKLQIYGGNLRLSNLLAGLGEIGRISSYNTGGGTEAASIQFLRDAMSDWNYGALAFSTIGTERMRITSGGNIGIGTTTPGSKLQVARDVTSAGLNYAQLQLTGATNPNKTLTLGYDTTNNVGFLTAGIIGTGYSNILVAPYGGNVGIGTSSPAALLHAVGSSNEVLRMQNSGAYWSMFSDATTRTAYFQASTAGSTFAAEGANNNLVLMANSNANQLVVATSGNIGIGTTVPLAKLFVSAANVTTTYNTHGNLSIMTTDSQAEGLGGSITLGGMTSGVLQRIFGSIEGRKTNSTLGDVSGYLSFKTSLDGVGLSERMRITNQGNVGIGTSTPSTKLEVLGVVSSTGIFVNGTVTTTNLSLDNDLIVSGSAYIYGTTLSAANLTAADIGASNANINLGADVIYVKGSSRRVGVGTTSPNYLLDVYGTAATQALIVNSATNGQVGIATNGVRNFMLSASSNSLYQFSFVNLLAGGMNVGIGTTSPKTALHVANNINQSQIVIEDTSSSANFHFGGLSFYRGDLSINTFTDALATTSRLFIASTTGNIGLGMTTPDSKLNVNSASAAQGTTGTIDVLKLSRPVNSNIAFPQAASFALGAYASTSPGSADYGPYTRLDINLKSAASSLLTTDKNVMSLLSNGNVGIGTTSPQYLMHLESISSGVMLNMTRNGGKSLNFGADTTSGYINSNGDLAFRLGASANTEYARFTNAGSLGIGTTSPSQTLHVNGGMRLTGAFADSASSTGSLGYVLQSTGTSTKWVSTSSLGIVGGASNPAGSDTQIQYNSAGSFGASSDFLYDDTYKALKVASASNVGMTFSKYLNSPTYVNFNVTTTVISSGLDYSGAWAGSTSFGQAIAGGTSGSSAYVNGGTAFLSWGGYDNLGAVGPGGAVYMVGGYNSSVSDGTVNIGNPTGKKNARLNVFGSAYLTGALLDSSNSTGTAGYVLQTNGTSTRWVSTSSLAIGGETAAPAGSDTQIQYNGGGAMAASNYLTWDNTSRILGVSATSGLGYLTARYINTGNANSLSGSATTTAISSGLDIFTTSNMNAYGQSVLSVTNPQDAGTTFISWGGGLDMSPGKGGSVYIAGGRGATTDDGSVFVGNPSGKKNVNLFVYGSTTISNNLSVGTSSVAGARIDILAADSVDSAGSIRIRSSNLASTTSFGYRGVTSSAEFKIQTGVGWNLLLNPNGGNVGIGSSSPSAVLSVKGSSTYDLLNITTTSSQSALYINSGGTFIGMGTTTVSTTNSLMLASGWRVTTGGSSVNASDRNLKENFTDVDQADILSKISALPLTQWNYKAENSDIKHIGPIAQDFYALFGLGGSDTSISTIDPAGIALVGIKALNENLLKQQAQINTILAVGSASSTGSLSAASAQTFYGTITVMGEAGFESKVVFRKEVEFEDHLTVDQDTAGTAIVPAGSDKIKIDFKKPYGLMPRVVANLQSSGTPVFINYLISDKSTTSFTILLASPAPNDLYFDWIALSTREPKGQVAGEATGLVNSDNSSSNNPAAGAGSVDSGSGDAGGEGSQSSDAAASNSGSISSGEAAAGDGAAASPSSPTASAPSSDSASVSASEVPPTAPEPLSVSGSAEPVAADAANDAAPPVAQSTPVN